MELTQELVKELFDYHEDGYLIWKIKPKNRPIQIGDRAGYLTHLISGDRYKVTIQNKEFLVSRVIFLYHEGFLPEMVDHRDQNKLNDRIGNLRAATRHQNACNVKARKNSTSKYLGVDLQHGKYWTAQIASKGKKYHIGRYKTEELAALAYNERAKQLHGEFANLNVIPLSGDQNNS